MAPFPKKINDFVAAYYPRLGYKIYTLYRPCFGHDHSYKSVLSSIINRLISYINAVDMRINRNLYFTIMCERSCCVGLTIQYSTYCEDSELSRRSTVTVDMYCNPQ